METEGLSQCVIYSVSEVPTFLNEFFYDLEGFGPFGEECVSFQLVCNKKGS